VIGGIILRGCSVFIGDEPLLYHIIQISKYSNNKAVKTTPWRLWRLDGNVCRSSYPTQHPLPSSPLRTTISFYRQTRRRLIRDTSPKHVYRDALMSWTFAFWQRVVIRMRRRSVGTSQYTILKLCCDYIIHCILISYHSLHSNIIIYVKIIDCMTTSAPIFVGERPIGHVTIIALVLLHVAQSLRRMMFKFAYREGINVWVVVLM